MRAGGRVVSFAEVSPIFRNKSSWGNGKDKRDAEQAGKAPRKQICSRCHCREQGAAAEDQSVSMQTVSGMGDKWTGQEPDHHGACQYQSNVLRL